MKMNSDSKEALTILRNLGKESNRFSKRQHALWCLLFTQAQDENYVSNYNQVLQEKEAYQLKTVQELYFIMVLCFILVFAAIGIVLIAFVNKRLKKEKREKDKLLVENDELLKEQNNLLDEKDGLLEEKNKLLKEKDEINEELKERNRQYQEVNAKYLQLLEEKGNRALIEFKASSFYGKIVTARSMLSASELDIFKWEMKKCFPRLAIYIQAATSQLDEVDIEICYLIALGIKTTAIASLLGYANPQGISTRKGRLLGKLPNKEIGTSSLKAYIKSFI
jgi:uncharacterized protein YhaN